MSFRGKLIKLVVFLFYLSFAALFFITFYERGDIFAFIFSSYIFTCAVFVLFKWRNYQYWVWGVPLIALVLMVFSAHFYVTACIDSCFSRIVGLLVIAFWEVVLIAIAFATCKILDKIK